MSPHKNVRLWAIATSVAVCASVGLVAYYIRLKKAAQPKIPEKEDDNLGIGDQEPKRSEPERIALANAARSRGNKYYNSGKLEEAINCYSESISLYPADHPELALAYSNRSAANLLLKKYEFALQDINESLNCNNRFCKALDRRSRILEGMDRLDDALEDAVAASIIDEFKTDSYVIHLETLLKKVSEQRAKEQYSARKPALRSSWIIHEFLRSFPQEWNLTEKDAPGSGGLLETFNKFLRASEYQNARNEIIKLAGENPEVAEVLNWLGTFQILSGEFEEALKSLDHALVLNPSQASAWVKKAVVNLELGRFSEMTEALDRAMKIDDKDPSIYYHRGEVHALSNNLEAAVADFSKAIGLYPSFVTAYTHKARALMNLGMVTKAKNFIIEALKEFPEDPDLLFVLGEIYAMDNEIDSANKCLERAQAKNPENAHIALTKVILMSTSGVSDDDLEAELRALTLKFPTFDAVHVQLAGVLLVKRKMKEALQHYDIAASNASSWQELVNIHSIRAISNCQVSIAEKYPDLDGKIQ